MGAQTQGGGGSESSIPKWLETPFKNIISEATGIYNAGYGKQPYPGATHIPLVQQQTQGLNAIQNMANQGGSQGLSQGLQNYGQSVVNNNGISQTSQAGLNPLNQVASGQAQVGQGGLFGAGGYTNVAGLALGPTAASQPMQAYASGQYLQEGNPYFRQLLDQQADKTAADVNRQFARMGRFGSGAHTTALADSIGGMRLQGLAQDYQSAQNNQFQAAGLLANERQQQIGGLLSSLQGQQGLEAQNIQNRINAAGGMVNAGLTGQNQAMQMAGLLPSLYDARYGDASRMMGVGGIYQQDLQQQLNDNINRYNEQLMAPWNNLNLYAQSIFQTGAPTPMNQQLPTGNPLMNIAGLATTGVGLAGNLFNSGLFSGWGGGGGLLSGSGASGGLAGLF